MKKFLLSEADRNELAAILSRQRSAPPAHPNATPQKPVYEEGDSYWALPPCETGLPAAELLNGQLKTVGIQCCAFRHTWGQDEMQPLLDRTGNPMRITVFNYYTRPENGLIQVYKHKDGSWTNERPERPSSLNPVTDLDTTAPPGFSDSDADCEGDCYWQANSSGVWQDPTGGCRNATTTTSTTTTTINPNQPGTTRYPGNVPTTVSPCIATKCTLVCIDTSTTPAPDEYGVPVPYQRFRYALKDGSVCPAGCTCYGLGDPCFLVEGELVSNCIGVGPTTTSTTTPNPNAPACTDAEFIFGTVPPNYYRAAKKRNGVGGWDLCQDCQDRTVPLFPLGGEKYRRHDWDKLSDVYETPCVKSPCVESNTLGNQNQVVYRAYHWDQQVGNWGWQVGEKFYDYPNKRFKANWFLCSGCQGNIRPAVPPPFWIYEDDAQNEIRDIVYDEVSNTYYYYATCVAGLSCDTCKRAPTRTQYDFQGPDDLGPPTTTNTTTTGAPTTTPNPFCGCSRPDFCPQPFQCVRTVCSKTGAAVFPSGATQTTVPPPSDLPCFPSNTTTVGPTTSTSPPSTTNAPNQCIGTSGQLCICATSTVPPSGGTCPPGYCGQVSGSWNCPEITCIECPSGDDGPGGPGGPDPVCNGTCYWLGGCNSDGTNCRWFIGGLIGLPSGVPGSCGINGCMCPQPNEAPVCDAERWTSCFDNRPPTTTSGPTTTPEPCGCCRTTTTINPCLTGSCKYGANTIGGWTLRSNTCRTACPCPPSSSITIPSQPCDSLTILCGGSPPTRPPTTSTTSTTTPSPGVCCLRTVSGRDQCVSPVSAVACAAFVANAPQTYVSSVFYPGITCTVGFCNQTTTPSPGACCLVTFQGTSPPIVQCFSAPSAGACNALGGSFQGAGTNCSSNPCSTTTSTTTTTTSTTTSTTTNNPTMSCCWRSGPFPICAAGYGSANCIAAGGVVISTCGACAASTTTTTMGPGTTTTTTVGPGTSTTPDPCLSCYIRQCGCSTGTEVACSEGTVLDCAACGCVPVTTTSTPTTAPPPL